MSQRYLYKANWIRVVSSEVVILDVDLGLQTHHVGPFRLKNLAADNSDVNRESLERTLVEAGDLRVETHNRDPDGQGWMVTIFCTDPEGKEININDVVGSLNVARILAS